MLTRIRTSIISWSPVLPVILAVSACSPRSEFRVSALSAESLSWDSARVHVSFERRPFIGGFESVRPDSAWVVAFDSEFDTLYQGNSAVLSLPDIDLDDGESVLIEACGVSGSKLACEQTTLRASPKRMVVNYELSYPLSEALDRGAIRLGYSLERKRFDSPGWEGIKRRSRPPTFASVFVSGHPGDVVEFPISRARTRFDLSRLPHYRDFRYRVKSGLMDADSVKIRFDIYTRLGPVPILVDSSSVIIRAKSETERRSELRSLAELAGGQLLERLKGFFGLRRAYVFINEWSYQPLEKSYDARIELHWQTGLRGRWYDMTGRLIVTFDGATGQFEFLRGSTSTRERWFSRMDSTIVRLDPLLGDDHLSPFDR
jgi:hypothetical protein